MCKVCVTVTTSALTILRDFYFMAPAVSIDGTVQSLSKPLNMIVGIKLGFVVTRLLTVGQYFRHYQILIKLSKICQLLIVL
jgi:hypothetical protein